MRRLLRPDVTCVRLVAGSQRRSSAAHGAEPSFEPLAQAATAASTGRSRSPPTRPNTRNGSERHVVDDLPGAGDLDEADDRGERRALHQLHQEADGGRDGDLAGLRQDHVAHARQVAQAERSRGLPLAGRDRLDAAAPDLAEECRGIQRQRDAAAAPADRCRRRAPCAPKNTRNSCISSGVPWNTWM